MSLDRLGVLAVDQLTQGKDYVGVAAPLGQPQPGTVAAAGSALAALGNERLADVARELATTAQDPATGTVGGTASNILGDTDVWLRLVARRGGSVPRVDRLAATLTSLVDPGRGGRLAPGKPATLAGTLALARVLEAAEEEPSSPALRSITPSLRRTLGTPSVCAVNAQNDPSILLASLEIGRDLGTRCVAPQAAGATLRPWLTLLRSRLADGGQLFEEALLAAPSVGAAAEAGAIDQTDSRAYYQALVSAAGRQPLRAAALTGVGRVALVVEAAARAGVPADQLALLTPVMARTVRWGGRLPDAATTSDVYETMLLRWALPRLGVTPQGTPAPRATPTDRVVLALAESTPHDFVADLRLAAAERGGSGRRAAILAAAADRADQCAISSALRARTTSAVLAAFPTATRSQAIATAAPEILLWAALVVTPGGPCVDTPTDRRLVELRNDLAAAVPGLISRTATPAASASTTGSADPATAGSSSLAREWYLAEASCVLGRTPTVHIALLDEWTRSAADEAPATRESAVIPLTAALRLHDIDQRGCVGGWWNGG
ncbi:hypothetical protein [Micromonospora mirobrigensis]|uniref:Uncharacterized protein n=1 Tax=Micromonospora mirobrigensis TaxID=262898 RepID=A0A1C4WZ65_9ACTN|nr:hypothetical protein [Micromonospora mirobrigensis]SCF01547.1 hypothetical protein GA0070564_102609 [Micromonospora mirobrigensis]